MQVAQARQEFVSIWGDRPLARNWRRIAAVMAADIEESPGEGAYEQLEFVGNLPEVDVSAVPRDSLSQVRMRRDRVFAWYELGNVLFLAINRPDSAATWYRWVIEEVGDDPVAQRAYYALAEVQRTLGDTLAANRIYREILALFPDSEFAVRAAEHLGMPAREAVVTDSLLLAEALYTEHYGVWEQGTYAPAMQGMMETAQQYPGTAVAPRALLAAGSVYMDWATQDSLSLFAPLPLTDSSAAWIRQSRRPPLADTATVQLKTLMEAVRGRYPESTQAARALDIVQVLDEEWAAIMAPLDSLRRLDSLAVVDSLAQIDSLAVMALVDSLMLDDSVLWQPADDSLLAGIRDSLYIQVRDSLDVAEKRALAAVENAPEREQAPPESGERTLGIVPDPQMTGGSNVSGTGEPLDPRMQTPLERDPSLGNIDWSSGGYTIVIRKTEDYEDAVNFTLNFGRTLPHPVDILAAERDRGIEFRVGMGLFGNVTLAQQAMQQMQIQLPGIAEIVRVPPSRPGR